MDDYAIAAELLELAEELGCARTAGMWDYKWPKVDKLIHMFKEEESAGLTQFMVEIIGDELSKYLKKQMRGFDGDSDALRELDDIVEEVETIMIVPEMNEALDRLTDWADDNRVYLG